LRNDTTKFVEGLDNFINMLEKGLNVPIYVGYLGSIDQDDFIKELTELKVLVENREIRYLMIG